jgi:hypothetical protein
MNGKRWGGSRLILLIMLPISVLTLARAAVARSVAAPKSSSPLRQVACSNWAWKLLGCMRLAQSRSCSATVCRPMASNTRARANRAVWRFSRLVSPSTPTALNTLSSGISEDRAMSRSEREASSRPQRSCSAALATSVEWWLGRRAKARL